jgi:hypothetical protein
LKRERERERERIPYLEDETGQEVLNKSHKEKKLNEYVNLIMKGMLLGCYFLVLNIIS